MPQNQIKSTDIYLAKSIDQVTRFGEGLKALAKILGIHDITYIEEGMLIKRYKSVVTLADGEGVVAEGEVIPLSKVELKEDTPLVATLKKYRKAHKKTVA